MMMKRKESFLTRDQIFTIPNLISLIRLLLVFPCSYYLLHEQYLLLSIVIAIAIASDFFDGILARKLKQISEFGKMLDPVADKVLVGTTAILLVVKQLMPFWLAAIIVGRDVAILIGGLLYAKRFKFVIPSNIVGKLTANVLAITLISYIFQIEALQKIFSYLAVVFIALSSVSYLIRLYLHFKGKKEVK